MKAFAVSLVKGDFECPGDLALLTPLCEHWRKVEISKGLTE